MTIADELSWLDAHPTRKACLDYSSASLRSLRRRLTIEFSNLGFYFVDIQRGPRKVYVLYTPLDGIRPFGPDRLLSFYDSDFGGPELQQAPFTSLVPVVLAELQEQEKRTPLRDSPEEEISDTEWWEQNWDSLPPLARESIERLEAALDKANGDWQRLQNNLAAMQQDRDGLLETVRRLQAKPIPMEDVQ